VVRVSSHREILPEHLVDKVDFGDHEAAAELAAAIIREGRRASAETIKYLQAHYRIEDQLAQYADAILNAEIAPPLEYRFTPITGETRFRLAPWCYEAPNGIYHDYRADYYDLLDLRDLVRAFPNGF